MNNRQAGRRRGRGGQQQRPQGNGGGGRPDNGNRIDSRARGNAAQLLEKYKNMARDAQMQGDRVNTEYYLQFADHYFRVLSDSRARFEEQNPNQQRHRRDDGANSFDQDDGDYEDEVRVAEQPRQQDDYRVPGERARDERPRDDQPRESRQRDDRPERARDDRPRGERQRDDRPREVSGNRYREEPVAPNGQGENGVEGEPIESSAEPYRREPVPTFANDEDVPAEPRRRGRPRRERAPVSADGDAPAEAFDANILPPSLGIAPAPAVDGDDAPAPRPRRRRAAAEGTAPAN